MPEVSLRKNCHEDSRKGESEGKKLGHLQTWEDSYILNEMNKGSIIHCRMEVHGRAGYVGSPSLKYFSYLAKNVRTLKRGYKPITPLLWKEGKGKTLMVSQLFTIVVSSMSEK